MENHYFSLLKTCWKLAVGYRKKIVFIYFLFVCANIVVMSQPFVFALLLNAVQAGGEGVFTKIVLLLILYEGLEFVFWAFHGPARVMERTIAFKIVERFTESMFEKIASLPLKWHKNHHSGKIISRVKKASSALNEFANNDYEIIQTIVNFIISLVAIFLLTPKFGALALFMGLAIILLIFRFDSFLVKSLNEINEKHHTFESTFFDYITNIRTVITLRLETLAKITTLSKIKEIFPVWRKNIIVNEVKWFSMNVGLAVLSFSTLFFYIYEKISTDQVIMAGSLMALYQYTAKFIDTFYRLGWQYERLVWQNTDLKSVAVIESAYNTLVKKQGIAVNLKDWKEIKISNLSFKYEDAGTRKHTLKDINLELKKGKKIAFVGESGSGKTTLISLLRGLDDAGTVNVDIDGVKFPSLFVISKLVTSVPQEPEIFENTIRYNLTAGIKHTKNDLDKVCKIAEFSGTIKKLPKGYETHIKEKGVNLSGGEKQRLALARGVFASKNADLILLDEPTSNVDSKNELKIYQNIFKEFSDRCIISSIHRLHLLPLFDEIIVFQNGEIVELGDFETLIKNKGLLAQFWTNYNKGAK